MRRMIMALIAGGVLAGAVYGAAASLGGVTGQNIAATDAIVVSCDSDGFDVGYNTALDTTLYPANQRATHVRIDSGLDPACALKEFRVRLTHDNDGPGPAPTSVIAESTFVIPAAPFAYPILFSLATGGPVPSIGPEVTLIDDMHWTQES